MSYNLVNPTTGDLTKVAGGTLYADAPLLTVVSSYDSVAAPGWARLTTDVAGRTLLRADYKELFDLVTKRGLIGAGKPFGEGNGSTTFVLPDAREATFKGIGLTSLSKTHYDADGVGLGEFVEDRIKLHAHNVYVRDTGHSHGTDSGNSLPSPNNLGITKNSGGVGWTANPVAGTANNTQSVSANIQVSSKVNFGDIDNATTTNGSNTNEVKSIGINYFMKVKQVAVPTDFLDAVDDIIKDTTVDAVTNGDMNPITSNAVYDAMNSVDFATIVSGTANVSIGDHICSKNIKNVCAMIKGHTSGIVLPSTKICSGFFTPLTPNTYAYLDIPFAIRNRTTNVTEMRMGYLDTNGDFYTSAYTENIESDWDIQLFFSYITD